MKTVLVFVVLFCGFLGSHSKLPVDFKVCKSSKDLNKCLAEAIEDALGKLKNGISDINVGAVDPIGVESAIIGEGTGVVHVVQNYKNFQINGVSTAKIPKVEATFGDKGLTLDIEAFIPEAKVVADYKFNGRILLLPIVGDGKCQLTLTDLKVKIKLVTEKIEKKGETYLKVTELHVELHPGLVAYNFEDLFGGNKALGDNMNKVLNDNWEEVFVDVKPGYEGVVEGIFKNYADQIFRKLAYKDLFD